MPQLDLFGDEIPATRVPFPGHPGLPLGNTPRLTSVQLDGLKLFDKVEVHLEPLTILTGPNNSGKSTVLQGIALGFECLRLSLDQRTWRLRDSGRAVTAFDFLPVNQPKDLWFKQIWKVRQREERYVKVGLVFEGGLELHFQVRFLFGVLNLALDRAVGTPDPEILKRIATAAPVLMPATPGPPAHEDYITLANIHRSLVVREPNRVVRNIIRRMQSEHDEGALTYVNAVLNRYFGLSLDDIDFDESRDLEIRAPVRRPDYSLDIVSEGAGLNQILQLAAIIAWKKPRFVLLDEPDSHLHSSVQTRLLEFLDDLARRQRVQVILATHSRDLIGQAPLESIVPVDCSRRVLKPLGSLDHLLLEFQRLGSVSNVDLALLYQARACLFVEGPTDERILRRLADRCGITIFSGRRQIVVFAFEGVEKLKFIPDLITLFTRMIGSAPRWGVLRDSDSHVPEVKAKHQEVGASLGAQVFHQWARHSIENYLLSADLLSRAIAERHPEVQVSRSDIDALLAAATESVRSTASATFITNAQTEYRRLELDGNPQTAGATAATRHLDSLATTDARLAAYPGKALFGQFVQRLQSQHGATLRLDDILSVIDAGSCPVEVMEVLRRIESGLAQEVEAAPE